MFSVTSMCIANEPSDFFEEPVGKLGILMDVVSAIAFITLGTLLATGVLTWGTHATYASLCLGSFQIAPFILIGLIISAKSTQKD